MTSLCCQSITGRCLKKYGRKKDKRSIFENGLYAFICTESGSRGNNLANRIVLTVLEYCKASGIRGILLSASTAGKPTYERIGFTSSPEMMWIFLK